MPLEPGRATPAPVRAFVPGRDEEAWLAVNNRAFDWHPEQGGWEIDQVKAMEGWVKYADRVNNVKRIPQQVNFAFQKALNGKPGPVYLDMPGDVLYAKVDEVALRPLARPWPGTAPVSAHADNAAWSLARPWPGSRS